MLSVNRKTTLPNSQQNFAVYDSPGITMSQAGLKRATLLFLCPEILIECVITDKPENKKEKPADKKGAGSQVCAACMRGFD